MSDLLWLLLGSGIVIVGAGWWRHRREQAKLRQWLAWMAALEHAERSKGVEDAICWNWDAMKKKRSTP